MNKYLVVQSTKSLNDIDSIFFYISEILENKQSAILIFQKIKARIDSLELFPERFQCIKDTPVNLKDMRATYVGKYTIYYRVNKEEMIVNVDRVIYSGIDISQLAID